MKKWIGIALPVILLITGIVYAKDYEVKKKIDTYDVEIKIDKNPPVVGDNNIEIKIKDPSDKYVTDAKVKIEYSMPAMSGMPPMNYKTDTELSGNKYTGKINLSMSGSWNISLKITLNGKTLPAVKFNVDAR
jgi:hypothetical protein